jgi:hypothetical protein
MSTGCRQVVRVHKQPQAASFWSQEPEDVVSHRRRPPSTLQNCQPRSAPVSPFVFIRLPRFTTLKSVSSESPASWTRTCLHLDWLFAPDPPSEQRVKWRHPMATTSETRSVERTLSDREFEDLLQRTWELIRNQKETHPLDPATESPSWT